MNWYITFTGLDQGEINSFWLNYAEKLGNLAMLDRLAYASNIEIIDYKATPHVDDVFWGGR